MKKEIIIVLILGVLFYLLYVVSAQNECVDNGGICVLSCSATYTISSYSCEPAVSAVCCVPIGDFACQKTEGFVCSSLNFNTPSLSKYKPEDYGLLVSELSCPASLYCYKKNFKKYNGAGNYSLLPGDEIHFDNNYIIKYINFHRATSWDTITGRVSGNLASIALYKGIIDYSNIGQDLITTLADINNVDKEKIKTFSNGFWIYAKPLTGESNRVEIEIAMGSLSSCVDTDAYSVGNTALELLTGKWGRNYYKKGTAIENREDVNGQKETKKEDFCSNNRLIEYYCENGELKTEEKKCECNDEGSCKKGFFDAILEWLGKTFGDLN